LNQRGHPVTGDAGGRVHDGDAPARQPVEQRRLAHVGPAHDGDHGYGHGVLLPCSGPLPPGRSTPEAFSPRLYHPGHPPRRRTSGPTCSTGRASRPGSKRGAGATGLAGDLLHRPGKPAGVEPQAPGPRTKARSYFKSFARPKLSPGAGVEILSERDAPRPGAPLRAPLQISTLPPPRARALILPPALPRPAPSFVPTPPRPGPYFRRPPPSAVRALSIPRRFA